MTEFSALKDVRTRPWNTVEFINTYEEAILFLQECLTCEDDRFTNTVLETSTNAFKKLMTLDKAIDYSMVNAEAIVGTIQLLFNKGFIVCRKDEVPEIVAQYGEDGETYDDEER